MQGPNENKKKETSKDLIEIDLNQTIMIKVLDRRKVKEEEEEEEGEVNFLMTEIPRVWEIRKNEKKENSLIIINNNNNINDELNLVVTL